MNLPIFPPYLKFYFSFLRTEVLIKNFENVRVKLQFPSLVVSTVKLPDYQFWSRVAWKGEHDVQHCFTAISSIQLRDGYEIKKLSTVPMFVK